MLHIDNVLVLLHGLQSVLHVHCEHEINKIGSAQKSPPTERMSFQYLERTVT